MLNLYKDFRRASRRINDERLRLSINQQIVSEFRTNSSLVDIVAIKTLMTEGKRNLEKLRAYTAFESPRKSEETSGPVGKGWPWMR